MLLWSLPCRRWGHGLLLCYCSHLRFSCSMTTTISLPSTSVLASGFVISPTLLLPSGRENRMASCRYRQLDEQWGTCHHHSCPDDSTMKISWHGNRSCFYPSFLWCRHSCPDSRKTKIFWHTNRSCRRPSFFSWRMHRCSSWRAAIAGPIAIPRGWHRSLPSTCCCSGTTFCPTIASRRSPKHRRWPRGCCRCCCPSHPFSICYSHDGRHHYKWSSRSCHSCRPYRRGNCTHRCTPLPIAGYVGRWPLARRNRSCGRNRSCRRCSNVERPSSGTTCCYSASWCYW
mmetsp:Transcript_27513/g.66171  ORF Transcript_27513/g.66171 Transcript_27513/m.66171 type:complete len:285 (-) Transcript_27513:569-1423(-)